MATPVKLYPIKDRWLNEVPRAVQVIATKADAEALIASGAFTDNPKHPDRDPDVEDQSDVGPREPTRTRAFGEAPQEEEPAEAGSPDSEAEE